MESEAEEDIISSPIHYVECRRLVASTRLDHLFLDELDERSSNLGITGMALSLAG